MNAEDKREQRLKLLEDDIGRKLAESAASGELRQARSGGKPLDLGDDAVARAGRQRLSEMQQQLALRLEKLRGRDRHPRSQPLPGRSTSMPETAATRSSP